MRRVRVVTLIAALAFLLSTLFLPALLTGGPGGAGFLLGFADGGAKLSARLSQSLESRYGGERGPGERRMGLLPSKPDPEMKLEADEYLQLSSSLAGKVDLTGTLPPIGDQGNQGSCVGWATSYYYKTWWEKQEHASWNLQNEKYVYSPSFVYNQVNGGQDAGALFEDAFTLLQGSGDVDIAEFPYNDSNYTRQPTAAQKQAARQYRIPRQPKWGYFFKNDVDWGGLGPFDNDLSEVKAVLNSGKPVVFGIPIFADFPDYNGNPSSNFYNYEGYNPDNDFHGGHAVYIAGYDDSAGNGAGGFLLVNSWGQGWNGSGRVYLSYEFAREYVWEAWFMDDLDSSPSISSVSPETAGYGHTLTISGKNFGTQRRSARVAFAGSQTEARVTSWNNAKIEVKVPGDAANGNVCVYDWNGEKSNGKQVVIDPDAPVPVDLSTAWMMAEGTTRPGFDEWVLVMNPSSREAAVRVTFYTPDSKVEGPDFKLAGQSRLTVHVNDYLPNQDVSTVVQTTNGVEVCAERAMYVCTADGKWGSHDSIGSMGTSERWFLAEGATHPGYDQWVLVMNPNTEPVEVEVTFQTPSGSIAGPTLQLDGGRRGTVHVNEYVIGQDVSTRVRSLTEGRGVVAERSMYIRTADGKLGCHNSMGVTETASGWGLAEGATHPGYEEWILVQNPTTRTVDVYVYFLTPDNVYYGPSGYLEGGTRASVRVNDYLPNSDVSTLVFTADESQKIVVERAMYVRTGDGKIAAHNSPASMYSCTDWYLPEGCTSGGFDDWVLVMNPSVDYYADVQLTFMTPGGPVAGPSKTLAPAARETFHINDYVAGDVSTVVHSDQYVVCERSMYVVGAPGKSGGHCSMGVLAPLLEGKSGAGANASHAIEDLRSSFPRK